MAYTKYSLTPGNNTAAPPDGAPEGMLPSAVNDTMRDMMAQIRDCGDGIRGGTYTMTAPVITGGSVSGATGSFTSLSDSGNLTFTGTGNRITGDTNNATISSRLFFQSSTANGSTSFAVLPNGTSLVSAFQAFNNSDPTNAAFAQLATSAGTEVRLSSAISGTGTYLPLTMHTGGSERLRIDTSGNVGIGTSSPGTILHTVNTSAGATTVGAFIQNSSNTVGTEVRLGFAANSATLSSDRYGWIGYVNTGGTNGGALTFATTPGGTAATERMRINSSGQLLVGATVSNGASLVISTNAGTTNWNVGPYNSVATNFYITGNNLTNGVLLNGVTATAWSALSDEKLKNVTGEYTNPLTDIAKIKPIKFTWKSDDTNKPCVGVIAQSVEQVVPEAVESNELPNSSDTTKYLSVRYTELIPLMIASIQELKTELDIVKAELQTLKGN
jgi:hypothetical protein